MANLFDTAIGDIKNNRNRGAWILGLIIMAFILLRPMLFLSNGFFDFLRRLFYTGYNSTTIILWGIWGLLIGAIYGAWVASKRYNLERKWICIPAGGLIFYIMVLYLIHA